MLAGLRRYFKTIATAWGLILGVALIALGIWYFFEPTRFRVAVVKGPEERILRALAAGLHAGRSLRLHIEEYVDFRAASQALESKQVELAVVQPDVAYPANAGTIAILREEMLIVLTPSKAKVTDVGKLATKRIALIVRRQADTDLLQKVFLHYDLTSRTASFVEISMEEFVRDSLPQHADALAFLGAPGTHYVRQIIEASARYFGSELAVVPLHGGSAFSDTAPSVREATIGVGTLRGRPQTPEEEVKTLSTSSRLVASTSVDRTAVSRVTEALFQQRQAIARSEPDANLFKAPDNDEAMTATLPNHRGAVDYFNREQLTFMDRYGDWLWLGLFAAGGATSVFGWLAKLFARRRREAVDAVLERLQRILSDARKCKNDEELQKLTLELDKLVSRAVRQTRQKATSAPTMSALIMSIDSARHAIQDQRREVAVGRDRPARARVVR